MPSLIGGGAEKTLINVLELFKDSQFEITVCSFVKKGVYLDKIPENVKLITIIRFEIIFKFFVKCFQKLNIIWPLKYLFNNKINLKYDLGICFLDGVITELLNHNKNINKRYTWVHSSYLSNSNFNQIYKNKKYVNRIKISRYKGLDGICFVSQDSKSEFIQIFGEFKKTHVIYNPVIEERIKYLASSETYEDFINDKKFKFIAVGSIIDVKNHILIINSIQILSNRFDNFIVYILGSGNLESSLKEKVKKMGLEKFIKFIGFKNNPYPIINYCNVFLMPSKSEALPTAMIEAMILAKPILTTNVPGCREVVEDGKYGLISELNTTDFASKMELCMSDEELLKKLSLCSLQRSKSFSKEKFLHIFHKIIDEDFTY
jgi:glycosyltransferase involved in cell wall biosynthesis